MNPDPAARLEAWLLAHDVKAERRTFAASCRSVAEAAAAVGARAEDFVKSVVFLAADGRTVVAVVKGEDRADAARVAEAVGAKVRVAGAEDVLARTGYVAGGVPPFGFEATFLVDPRVLGLPAVWAGGGTATSLLRVDPRDVVRAAPARVVDVRR